MVQYIVRRMSKILYGEDHVVMFEWFVCGFWPKESIKNVVIEAIQKGKKGSQERRIFQAVLHASFTLEELKRIMSEHEDIMDGYEESAVLNEVDSDRSKDGDCTTVDSSGKTSKGRMAEAIEHASNSQAIRSS